MLQPSPTDDWIVSVLRNVETPEPPAKLFSVGRRARRGWRWLASAGIVSAGAVAALVLTLQPQPTLAQVAAAQKRVERFVIVNTRILTDGRTFRVTQYRDGRRWGSVFDGTDGVARSRVVGDSAKTIMIFNYPPYQNETLIDAPEPRHDQGAFDVERMLRPGKPFSRTRTIWHGVSVDRFESHSTYPGIRAIETYDQVVIADARSHLPLRMEVFRNNHKWGDTWDFSYGPVPESIISTPLPPGMPVFDLRDERERVARALSKGPVLLVGQLAVVAIILPDKQLNPRLRLRVEGISDRLQRTWSYQKAPVPFGGRSYGCDLIALSPSETARFDQLRRRSTTTLRIDGKPPVAVPVIKVGEVQMLLRLGHWFM